MEVRKMVLLFNLFNWVIFKFHVNFQGWKWQPTPCGLAKEIESANLVYDNLWPEPVGSFIASPNQENRLSKHHLCSGAGVYLPVGDVQHSNLGNPQQQPTSAPYQNIVREVSFFGSITCLNSQNPTICSCIKFMFVKGCLIGIGNLFNKVPKENFKHNVTVLSFEDHCCP